MGRFAELLDQEKKTGRFSEILAGEQEGKNAPGLPPSDSGYQQWLSQHGIKEDPNYDTRAAFKAGLKPDERGHLSDEFKMPHHPTFSTESRLSGQNGKVGGEWLPNGGDKWTFKASPWNLKNMPKDQLTQYFDNTEQGNTIQFPDGTNHVGTKAELAGPVAKTALVETPGKEATLLGTKRNIPDRHALAEQLFPDAKVYSDDKGTITVRRGNGDVYNIEDPSFSDVLEPPASLDMATGAEGKQLRTNANTAAGRFGPSTIFGLMTGKALAGPGGGAIQGGATPLLETAIAKMTPGPETTDLGQLGDEVKRGALIGAAVPLGMGKAQSAFSNVGRDIASALGHTPSLAQKAMLALGIGGKATNLPNRAAFNMADEAIPPSAVLADSALKAPAAIAEAQSANPAARQLEENNMASATKGLNIEKGAFVRPEVEANLKNDATQTEVGATENVNRAAQRRLDAKISAEGKVKSAKNDYLDNQEQQAREQSTEEYARQIQEGERRAKIARMDPEDAAKVKPLEPAYPPQPKESFRPPETPELAETARGNMVAKQQAERSKNATANRLAPLEGNQETLPIRAAQVKHDPQVSEALRSRIAGKSMPGEFDEHTIAALKADGSPDAERLMKLDGLGKTLKESAQKVSNAAPKAEPFSVDSLFKRGAKFAAKGAATTIAGPFGLAYWANKGLKNITSDQRALNSILGSPEKLSALYDVIESGLPKAQLNQQLRAFLTSAAVDN